MKLGRDKLISLAVAAMVGCWMLTYFVKPRPAHLEFVTPQQQLPNYTAQYPGDTKLIDRIVKSYELAMILVQTPYIQKNFTALESIRRWAREEFAERPDFLHPAVLELPEHNRDTVFGALGYNMFAGLQALAQEQIGYLLRWRITNFHDTYAYQTFRTAYFDLFGWDAEAAVLLARYQNDRAKIAVDVLLWSISWTGAAVVAGIYLFKRRKSDFFGALQRVTASTWLLMALAYMMQAWDTEQASSVISLLVSTAISAYMFFPVAIISHEEAGRRLARIRFTPNWVALTAWLTISVLAVQILTWIRHSLPGATDPMTMLIQSLTGNFVHDPIHGKRLITTITAVVWSLAGFWTFRQQSKTYETDFDAEIDLNKLGTGTFERIR